MSSFSGILLRLKIPVPREISRSSSAVMIASAKRRLFEERTRVPREMRVPEETGRRSWTLNDTVNTKTPSTIEFAAKKARVVEQLEVVRAVDGAGSVKEGFLYGHPDFRATLSDRYSGRQIPVARRPSVHPFQLPKVLLSHSGGNGTIAAITRSFLQDN